MGWFDRLIDSFRSRPLERDIAEEQKHHIELAASELQDQGLSAEEAQRQAELRFGNAGLAREDTRRQDLIPWLDDAFRDLRIGARGLRRSPSYSIVVLLTLALGIGANTALFSIMNKLLLEMLPVERPRELVILNPNGLRNGWTPGEMTWSYPAYRGICEAQQVFTGLLAERIDDATLTLDGAARRVTVSIVSGNYFEVLGVKPLMGRLLSPDDDRVRSGHAVAILSHGFWLSQLGGRTDILGQTVLLKGHPFTVVGIGEKGFNGLEVGGSVDVFVPAAMLGEVVTYGDALDSRTAYIFQLYGRLKGGVTRAQAEAQLQPLYLAQLEQDVPLWVDELRRQAVGEKDE